jgi:hypothetical protein
VRTHLRELAEKELVPLEESKSFSDADARQVLLTAQGDLAEYRFDHDYPRLMRVCALLAQAMQERGTYLQRSQQDDAKATPSTSRLKTSSLQTSTSIASGTQQSSSAFFKEATLREWRERCELYKAQVEQLLVPAQ